MHTEKDLTEQFIAKHDYPIWYYKELESVNVSYVIMNLLKEHYVVEIEGHKYGLTFGINKSDEIGSYILYDQFHRNSLSSYKILEKGFQNGKWFIVTENNTSEEFKDLYKTKLNIYKEKEKRKDYKEILINFILSQDNLAQKEKNRYITDINTYSDNIIEKLVNQLFKSCDK